MKRAYVLGVIVMSGALAAAAAQLSAQQPPAGAPPAGAPGQGRPGGPPGAPPGGARGGGGGGVEAARKIVDNLYWVPGAGGNTAIFVTGNGVVLVDTKLANNGQAILDQVKSVTSKPVTHIINTHTHGDHNGSNVFFPATVEIVTQENTKANMEKMPAFADAANKHGLPDRTFKERETLLSGNDAIDLYYYGAAHTNGDAFVVFRNLRVMHAGDVFANKGLPNIDGNNGGSGLAYGETIGKAAAGIKNVQTVITGHNTMTTMTWQDFVDYGEFNRLYAQYARESLKAGKSAEQAAMDLKLPDKFKDYQLTGGRGGPGGNFGRLFEELKTAK
jgi:glyoxylase-like metal-dependent hydrolase (beta-lactamase superfamily II)